MKIQSKIILSGLAALLTLTSAQAAITVLGTDSAVTAGNSAPGDFTLVDTDGDGATRDGTYSYAFNAGATSDMLVVSLSYEASSEAWSVTYNGVSMNLATQSSAASGTSIFYLANPSATGSIAIDFTGKGTVNGIGLGIASLNNSGNPIYFNNEVSTSGVSTIDITPDFADSFVMFAGDANSTAGSAPTLSSNLTPFYAGPSDIGSNTGAAGYENAVAASLQTYSWTPAASPRGISVAAFSAIPEPSSFVLMGLGLAGLFLLRRKN